MAAEAGELRRLLLISCVVALLSPFEKIWARDAAEITLPDVLAIELPPGARTIGPGDSPLRELLTAARSGKWLVTSDLNHNVGPGPIRVTWTAWEGLPAQSEAAATRTARVIILPFGLTPVGVSADENATAGNGAVHIARDSMGVVHMVWADSGRPGGGSGAVYRRAAVTDSGLLRFETGPIYVAGYTPSDGNSYPALAVAGDQVQLVWQDRGTVRTRRLTRGASGWVTGPIYDTGAKSGGRDIGPAIAIDAHGGVHIATPDGFYGFSANSGQTWKTETIPLPANEHIKTISLAVDPAGAAHLAFSTIVTRPVAPLGKLGSYWRLRTVTRTTDGKWIDAADVLGNMPGWGEPHGSDDVLADWVRIAADERGALHLTWHGTVESHRYGDDLAFYSWRRPGAAWQAPIQLVQPNPTLGIKFSFAPSLALDADRALPLVFYDVYAGPIWIGFDSDLAVLRNGRVDRPPIPVTQFVRRAIADRRPDTALSSWFPAVAPAPWHSPDGHVWLDVAS